MGNLIKQGSSDFFIFYAFLEIFNLFDDIKVHKTEELWNISLLDSGIFFSFILDMNLQVVYMPSRKCDCSDYYIFILNRRRNDLHSMANLASSLLGKTLIIYEF